MTSILALVLATTATATAMPAPAVADQAMPHPLPGLWNAESVLSTGTKIRGRICIGATLPDAWRVIDSEGAGRDCKAARRREGDQGIVEVTCKLRFGKVRSSMHMQMIGAERSMHMVIDIAASPAGGLDAPSHMEASYSYAGACPPTLKEGQMEQSDGTITDLSGDGKP